MLWLWHWTHGSSKRGQPVFDMKELEALDPKYFVIINKDPYDVTIRRRCTRHYWYLHNPEYPDQNTVIIFHSHRADRTGRVRYHMHGRANTLKQAVTSIKGHDNWKINGQKW